MKYKSLPIILTILIFPASLLFAEIQSPIPMKDFHIGAFDGDITCTKCHDEAIPTERPNSKKCIECHGEMSDLAKLTAAHDRNPHASNHYMFNIECATCHAEHKPSKALCNDCHQKYSYPKLK